MQLSREDNCDGTCGSLSQGWGGALSGACPLGQDVSFECGVHFRLKGHGGCGAQRRRTDGGTESSLAACSAPALQLHGGHNGLRGIDGDTVGP